MKLTDRQIKNLKPQADRYEVFEDRGFGIRGAPTGRKTFIFFYRMPGESEKRRLTIGTYPTMPLAEAHRKYAEAREMVTQGVDPGSKTVAERDDERKAASLATLANEYLEKWAKPRKRSWREDKRILEKDVLPIWGQRKAKDITRRDVIRLLDDIVDRGAPIMANRTLAVIRRMFNFAINRDIVPVSPCMAVRSPAPEQRRDRVLTQDEVRALWHGLEGEAMSRVSEGIKLALKLELVTGQRKSEVVSAAWDEIDLAEGWWTIPAEKTMLRLTHNVEAGLAKNKLAHRVPLCLMAVELLQRVKALSGDSPWLFPSPRGNKPITPEAVNHALRLRQESLGIAFVPHDLRRTAATNMASMGISSSIIGKILNHKDRTVLAIHYNHYDYDREKKQAMETWGRKLQGIVEGAEPGYACHKPTGHVHCPAHADTTPSLSVTEKGGKILVKRFGGCSQDRAIATLRSPPLSAPGAIFSRGKWKKNEKEKKLEPLAKFFLRLGFYQVAQKISGGTGFPACVDAG